MPVVQIEAQLTTNALLEAVDQMSLPEMEEFTAEVLALRARRKAPGLSQAESDLLMRISQGLSVDSQARLRALVGKRQAETLTPEEHRELLSLTGKLEEAEVARAEALAKLATLRGISLPALMQDLGISTPDYV